MTKYRRYHSPTHCTRDFALLCMFRPSGVWDSFSGLLVCMLVVPTAMMLRPDKVHTRSETCVTERKQSNDRALMSRWRSRSFPSMMRITQTPCPKIRWQECSRTSIMAWRYGQSGSVGVGTVASMLTWQLQVEQEEIDTIIDRASQASCMSARGLSGALSDSSCFLTCLRRARILCIRWLAAPSQGQV